MPHLLRPENLVRNYVHQLSQTISAYLPGHIFVGEALQNALDAAQHSAVQHPQIRIELDLDIPAGTRRFCPFAAQSGLRAGNRPWRDRK
jgi:hypothetical protein